MIVSPIPGMTPARASEHTLQGLISNLNGYAEGWVAVATAGTNTILTTAQVLAKNLRLEAGASGAFTLTLPPTSKIIDLLGPTLPQDGSFWFPLYIYNNGVGQTATLTAGDADTVIDPTNNTIPDGHVTKWMVNVVAAANGQPTTPMTLNFHNAFTACCSAAVVPDIPPVMLQFGNTAGGTGGNDANMVLQYDLTAPGTSFARVIDAAPLGTGGTTYAPNLTRAPIYNVTDDRMYFLATKTAPGPTVTAVLVQYDPRNLVISGEMTLPAGWDTSNSFLVDVTDAWAWIQSGFDTTFRAFDTVSFTEMFNDAGALATLAGGTTNGSISCASGTLILPDGSDPNTIHLVTVTSPTTFVDTAITTNVLASFSNTGDFRRRWIADRNKVLLVDSTLFSIGYALLDLNDVTMHEFRGVTDAPDNNGGFWDPYANRFVGTATTGLGFGGFLSDDTGADMGVVGLNNADWVVGPQTLGGLLLAANQLTPGYGGFDETVVATTPTELYTTTDNFVSTGGNTWVQGNECIALRRVPDSQLPVFRRGNALAAAYSGTGTSIAFFQLPRSLASDDNLQWQVGTGITNALNNDAATYSTSGTPGVATATFTTVDGKTVTVTQGLITSVV